MLTAIRQKSTHKKINRLPVSTPTFIQAPTKGWYVGANLADAPAGTCYILDNAFPQLDYVRMRRGALSYATGMGGSNSITSLIPYIGATSQKLFAFTNGNIYDVSSGGAVGAAAVSGLNTSAYLEYVQFTGTGGTYLIVVNGQDAARNFDGTTWATTPAITGLGNPLAQIWPFKNRLYGVERDTLNAWYLPLDSIGGAATKFPLTSIFRFGGSLLCGASWSISASSGIYETCIFITTEGEVAVYDGAYPGDTAWTLKGLYKISKPLGRRCLFRAGGDIAVMTEDGIVPLSQATQLDQIALQNKAVTAPIAPAWRQAVIDRKGLSGWQFIAWPLESMGIVNLPKTSASDNTQFIANARTGAWARYLGWDANCFAVYNNNLYYGTSDGRVMQAETGGQDDGKNYTLTIFPSYTSFKNPASRKQVRMVRPRMQASFPIIPQVTVKVDYDTTKPLAPTSNLATPTGSLWDSAIWDSSVWPADLSDQSMWVATPGGLGTVVSPVIQLTLSVAATPDIRLTATELIYESANAIG